MKIFILLIISSFFLSSCSVFHSSRRMDMSPFAENTRALFGEAIKIERPFQYKYLIPYLAIPEFRKARELAPPFIDALKGIVYYSNQVVAINNAKLSEKDKCHMLADYLDEAMKKAVTRQRPDTLQVDIGHAKVILDNIRSANSYLDGLAAAEPIVHSVVSAMLSMADDFQDQIPIVISGFNREIEKDFEASRENYERLIKLQEKVVLSITRLYNARLGNFEDLETAMQENPSIRNFIPSPEKATHENLARAEGFLLEQSKEIVLMISQLDDIKKAYRAKKDEVAAWRAELDDKVFIARTSLSVWARAHKNLGAGIPVPPLIDVAGIAGGLAGSAAKVIIP